MGRPYVATWRADPTPRFDAPPDPRRLQGDPGTLLCRSHLTSRYRSDRTPVPRSSPEVSSVRAYSPPGTFRDAYRSPRSGTLCLEARWPPQTSRRRCNPDAHHRQNRRGVSEGCSNALILCGRLRAGCVVSHSASPLTFLWPSRSGGPWPRRGWATALRSDEAGRWPKMRSRGTPRAALRRGRGGGLQGGKRQQVGRVARN